MGTPSRCTEPCTVPDDDVADVEHRLPGRRRRRHGHGVHRRPDRPRRRARDPRRPPARRRRALAGRLPVRPAPPGVAVLRRGVDRARHRRGPVSTAPRPDCTNGPAGRRSRPTTTTSCTDRFLGSGRVHVPRRERAPRRRGTSRRHLAASRARRSQVDVRRRVVDATYLSPTIPATTPPPFGVADGARVVAVNELADLVEAPSAFVIVGSGQDRDRRHRVAAAQRRRRPTASSGSGRATPGCSTGRWCSPTRWSALGLAADTMAAATEAASLDDLFLRLEAAGVMLRVDPDVAAHDGQGADARRLGARPAAQRRATSSASATSSA